MPSYILWHKKTVIDLVEEMSYTYSVSVRVCCAFYGSCNTYKY